PLLPGVQIADVELPVLARVVEPGAEALRLLLFRDVDEELDDRRALVGEETLELDDVVIAPPPTRLGDEALDAYHEDVLVVAPVEYHDLPVAGDMRMHPPQVVVGEFLLRGLLEGGDPHALGVHPPEDVPDRRVLPCR